MQHKVNEQFIRRSAWHSPVTSLLQNPDFFGPAIMAMMILPLFLPLLTPLSILGMLFTGVIFNNHRWRCPMRMPATLKCDDPSEDREETARFLGAWNYTRIRPGKARGLFFLGTQRGSDVGRELWLSQADLVRHIMFFSTTGGGKTETLFSLMLNSLCHARGFTMMDGKAQNDTARTIWYLALRFGREDDVEFINYMTGGRSRSELLHAGDKSLPESNSFNPFVYATETLVTETLQSMLPQNVQGGEWQSRAIAMNKALVSGVKYLCVAEKRCMSMQLLREYMPLEKMAALYVTGVDTRWPEEALSPLKNYLQELPGFDMAHVRTPAMWTEEPRKQHGYLTGQFSETYSTFTETYGHIFAQDAGDIDQRDSIHSDRILITMIPALELSSYTASALGKIMVTQQSMILARDLGHRIGGTDEEALEVKKYATTFPYINYLDEIGAYYAERITAMATQVRSLYFALLMAAQDTERMEGTAGGNSVSTLMQNAGVKISGKIVSDEKTMNILRRAAGQEAHARMDTLKRKDGLLGTDWQDGDQTRIVDKDKLKLKDLINLQAGENVTIFNGHPVAGTSMYIPDSEKTSGTPVQINRLIQVDPIPLAELRHLVPRESERRIPRPEKVSRLIGILKGEVESPVDSFTLISPVMRRLHDECASQVLDMPDIFDISEAVYNLYSLLYTADIRTNRISLISNAPPQLSSGDGECDIIPFSLSGTRPSPEQLFSAMMQAATRSGEDTADADMQNAGTDAGATPSADEASSGEDHDELFDKVLSGC